MTFTNVLESPIIFQNHAGDSPVFNDAGVTRVSEKQPSTFTVMNREASGRLYGG